MQTGRVFPRVFALGLLIGIAVVVASIWNASRVKAFNQQPSVAAFGAFGITHDQTARLAARVFVPESNSAPSERLRPVVIEFDFHDGEDNLIRSLVQTVEPGHSAFLDLNGGEIPRSDVSRTEYQPCVRVVDNPNRESRVQVMSPRLKMKF